ncbi:MAG: hypothetical protein WC642_16085 [Nocardioides sp.]
MSTFLMYHIAATTRRTVAELKGEPPGPLSVTEFRGWAAYFEKVAEYEDARMTNAIRKALGGIGG